ncbi:uncharacterized protein LOC121235462 [Juglans microcarpa x Juglans regia]|uniref:uncharacterized protein LOC121235462 n=1 Tax=Juglans microcarpa x Juglans regia TaxID=2249226 RepID=UPI001B7F4800|nr:uncharacterized protein LOC121235462 [Juglans microcarpa x Juglans regia]
MVEDFIDTTKGEWRGEMVVEELGESEADIVKTIPIQQQFLLIDWGYTKSRIFSVKSTYHLEMRLKKMAKGEPSRTNNENGLWNEIWKLNVPAIVKNFVWKATNNCLPTKENLLKRKVVELALCPICSREVESVTHSLWSCATSSDIWAESVSPIKKWPSYELDFYPLWGRLVKNLNQGELEKVAAIMRKIWLRRNKFVFEEVFSNPYKIIRTVLDNLEEYQRAEKDLVCNLSSAVSGRAVVKWKRPSEGW